MSAALIEVRDLAFRYDDGAVALAGVDFTLAEGETVAVFGANGSDKTTFVQHLNGLLTGTGRVTVCGLEMNKGNLTEIRRLVGLLFQDPDEQLFMPTVIEDVTFGPLNLGWEPSRARREAHAALERVGMAGAAGKPPYHLSAGEKKRVALAGILAMQPRILVLDEPGTYLDPPGRRDLSQLLAALPQAKVVVTHDTSFAREIASRAVFFQAGRIAGEGSVDQVVHRFRWDDPPSNA